MIAFERGTFFEDEIWACGFMNWQPATGIADTHGQRTLLDTP